MTRIKIELEVEENFDDMSEDDKFEVVANYLQELIDDESLSFEVVE